MPLGRRSYDEHLSKGLNLVEGVAGSKGGFRATAASRVESCLNVTNEDIVVPIVLNGVAVENTRSAMPTET
jgi:predicted transcriptional regulator